VQNYKKNTKSHPFILFFMIPYIHQCVIYQKKYVSLHPYCKNYNMKYFYLLIISLLFISIDSPAKIRHLDHFYHRHSYNDTTMIVQAYVDSLTTYKYKLDSIKLKYDSLNRDNMNSFHLFEPLTFFHSVTGTTLSLESPDSTSLHTDMALEVDRTLMNIYLKRPDLVLNSESRIQKYGSIRQDLDRPFQQNVLFAEKTAPKPEEPLNVPMDVIIKRPNFWKFKGDYYLQLLQNFVTDNWYKGGENNYSMVASATIEANYNNKSRLKFDNKLEMKLGFQTTESDTLHKFKTNNDLLRYTGKLGLQATNRWYYTFQFLASTQFAKGYKNNDDSIYSDFLSPITLNFSLGMDYTVATKNNVLSGSINLAPLAYNFKYVDRLSLATRNGIDEGHHALNDFGSEATFSLKWNVNKLIKWETRLYGYTTYKRAEIEWENTFTVAFSKYISAKIFVYPRFDDGTKRDSNYGYWQYKEYSSLGLALSY
jgi:hypothetical protein